MEPTLIIQNDGKSANGYQLQKCPAHIFKKFKMKIKQQILNNKKDKSTLYTSKAEQTIINEGLKSVVQTVH